jgi:fido (protein-threonine AMPylation protein)
LISIHKQLFEGVFTHAGKLRTYNFTKKEWALDGASVLYSDYRLIETTLQYDFDVEKRFNYAHLSTDEIIDHLAIFISNIWQIHAFEEGNTRTTAVFTIKYLRSLGYDVTNDSFAKNAWYFRNALVRANYKHLRKGIYEDRAFIVMFLRNLILGEKNQLHNRDLHVSLKQEPQEMSREDRIIDQINANPSVKLEEIAQALNVSLRTIKSVVASLVKNNKIERVGGKKAGYWKIKH